MRGTYCLVWLWAVRNNLYLLNDVEIDGRRLKDSSVESARRADLSNPMQQPHGRNDDVATV